MNPAALAGVRSLQIRMLTMLLVASVVMVPRVSRSEEEGCTAAKCHAALTNAENTHTVLEMCDSCHTAVEAQHPQRGKKTFKLAQDQPDLCYSCHDKFGTKKNVHFPVENSECTTCHNPHSSAQPKLLLKPKKELCTGCHEDVLKLKEPHGPVSAGDCTACHQPHESDRDKLLTKDEDELCLGCHNDMKAVLEKSNVHAAVSTGCNSCHKPHGSDHKKLLAADLQQVCFDCHSEVQDTVTKAKVSHPALDMQGCVGCHSPHASDHPGLLLSAQVDTCVECHDSIHSKQMKVLHGADHSGKCTDCHAPHGADFEHLLVGEFPSSPYVPYTDSEFALCFKCHKRELLQFPETSFATEFRDGEKNLHYVHVNKKEKARSCALCHSQHGSNNPKLIADSVKFGQWDLPIKFTKTETGGGCAPGCHKPLYYDRKSPGRKPPGK